MGKLGEEGFRKLMGGLPPATKSEGKFVYQSNDLYEFAKDAVNGQALNDMMKPADDVVPAFANKELGSIKSKNLITPDESMTMVVNAMDDVDELATSNISMMPEGMLRNYSDEQVRDLLLYLASPQQVPLTNGFSGQRDAN